MPGTLSVCYNPRCARYVEMTMQDPQDTSSELLILTGLRAMLGDQRSKNAMEKVRGGDPATFRWAMAKAESRYRALSEEERANPERTLNKLVISSMRLKSKLALAGGPRAFLASLPRALKRIVWR